jgi:hypothetical protein
VGAVEDKDHKRNGSKLVMIALFAITAAFIAFAVYRMLSGN